MDQLAARANAAGRDALLNISPAQKKCQTNDRPRSTRRCPTAPFEIVVRSVWRAHDRERPHNLSLTPEGPAAPMVRRMEREETHSMRTELTVERLRQLVHYSPRTGRFYWRERGGERR